MNAGNTRSALITFCVITFLGREGDIGKREERERLGPGLSLTARNKAV